MVPLRHMIPGEQAPTARNGNSRLAVWWPLTFGVTIGVEILLAVLVLFGPARLKPELAAQLTPHGRIWFQPERDLVLYAAGCLLTTLLVGGFSWLWQTRVARTPAAAGEELLRRGCAQLSVAGTLFLAHLGLLLVTPPGSPASLNFPWWKTLVLALSPGAALLVATVGRSWNLGWVPAGLVRLLSTPPNTPAPAKPSFHRFADVLVPILLGTLIYIPAWREYFGWYFLATDWCHHWDYFATGPMLAFHHGKALGTEAYAQYGVGWPVVFGILHGFEPMTYARFVHLGTIFGGAYFLGVYLFLRLALGNAIWSAAGVLLALSLQMFHGLAPGESLWEWPSSTVLRSPMDIWFFLALLLHLRTGRVGWAVIAGALVGLGMVFVTETGLYLSLVFVTYWVFRLARPHGPDMRSRSTWLPLVLSLGTGAVVLLAGLAVASRGTLWRPEFWPGWLEAQLSFAAGMTMLPFAKINPGALSLFALFITAYLATFGVALLNLLQRRPASGDLLTGGLALYGLLALLLFVGRSETSKLFHPSVPFALVMTLTAARWHQSLTGDPAPDRHKSPIVGTAVKLVPWCALGGMIVWLAANPVFQQYPGILQTVFAGSPLRKVKGPPPEDQGFVPEFAAVVSRLRERVASGHSVAVLDAGDTPFYLAANAPPWWRYSPAFTQIARHSELAALERDIITRGPQYILIRADGRFAARWFYQEEEAWQAAHAAVQRCYRREDTVGNFELWRRNE